MSFLNFSSLSAAMIRRIQSAPAIFDSIICASSIIKSFLRIGRLVNSFTFFKSSKEPLKNSLSVKTDKQVAPAFS